MAKSDKPLPADLVKAAKAIGIAPSGQLETAVLDSRSEEERLMAEPNAVELDEADLDAADAQEVFYEAPKSTIDLSMDPVVEDPEIAAERKRRFDAAIKFEQDREANLERKRRKLAGEFEPAPVKQVPIPPVTGIPDIFFQYATALPPTTPDEHVLCGYGQIKLRVGDFRRLVGLPSRL